MPFGRSLRDVEHLLRPWGELLPVDVEGERGALFHCTNVIDALDLESSDPYYAEDGPGRVVTVTTYAFKTGVVPDGCAFRLPIGQPGFTFYTHGLVEAMAAATDTAGVRFLGDRTAELGALRVPRRLDRQGRPIVE